MSFVRALVLSAAVVCVTLAASASAAFAADYTAKVSPSAVRPGSSATFTVALSDESPKNPLNAAIVTPPAGFTLTAASLQSPSGNATVQTQDGQVVVKGLSLKQNQGASILVTANTPATCGQSSWTVQAFKSSLNGPQLTLDTQNSSLTTTVTSSACQPVAVKFAAEPSSAYVGQTISSSPFNPLGPPVTVDLVDANDDIVDFSAPVTIALGDNPGGSTLSGTLTQTAVHGVATFNDLSLDKPGSGYTLVASSPGLTNDTSSPFGENSQTVSCPAPGSTSCPSTTLDSPPGSPTPSSITVTTTGSPGDTGTLSLSVNTGTRPTCSREVQGLDQNFYGVLYTPTTGGQVAKTITYTILNTPSGATDNLCFAAPYEFETLGDGIPNAGTLPDGSPGFIGFLETCDPDEDGATPDPCQTVASVPDGHVSTGFDTVFTISIPAGLTGDPFAHG